jgi:3-deoxy-manno-octulosonate cytidylyltransferase (CMP-KDO synthetase)
VQHVYEQAMQCGFDSVLVATDHQSIVACAQGFGADVVMTDVNHPTGTDRLSEAVALKHYDADDIIVNIQGDEPLIPVENVMQVAKNLADRQDVAIATLCEAIDDEREIFDAHAVKVVMDHKGHALYFSRATIPWQGAAVKSKIPVKYYRHIGMYAYRCAYLQEYATLAPSPLEQWESLEQLRALYYGHKIHVEAALASTPPGVDTQADLARVQAILAAR